MAGHSNVNYKKVGESSSQSQFVIDDNDDEEEVDLRQVDLGETSRHGLTTQQLETEENKKSTISSHVVDLCSGALFFSVWNTLTFGWMDSLLRKGSEKALDTQDLPDLLPPDKAQEVYRRFRSAWCKQLDEVEVPSLFAALAQGFGTPFMFAGCIKLVHDSSLFLGPLLLNRLIRFLSDPSQPMSNGLVLVACLFCVNLCQSLCLRQYFWLCFRTGMNLRTAIVTAIYSKTMVISGDAIGSRTTGEITNLMSVDAGRLQDLTPYLHAVWYSVFQIILAMYCLWQQMGVSCLSGIAVIICMIPISNRVSFYMKSLQKTISKTRDERVKITNETLSGMKVLKLQAWERQFQQRIMKVREEEMKILLGYSKAQCFATAVYTAIPLLVALTTFATYISLGNTLDIATALTSLALFELLRFPLFMLPQVVNSVVEAMVSVERISSYLLAPEFTPVAELPSSVQSSFGVFLDKATFVYECALTRSQFPDHIQTSLENDSGEVCIRDHPGDACATFDDIDNNHHVEMSQLVPRRSSKRFTIESFVQRPPLSEQSPVPRHASNLKRFQTWFVHSVWLFLQSLKSSASATARGEISRSPSLSSVDGTNSIINNAHSGTAKPTASTDNKHKKQLSSAEKMLLVHIALLKDAEERLNDLENQLGLRTAGLLDRSLNRAADEERNALLGQLTVTGHEDDTREDGGDDDGSTVNIQISDSEKISQAEVDNDGKKKQQSRRMLPLRHVSFSAKPGQLVAVVGAVGSGKSSLLQALLGQLQQVSYDGRVCLSGELAFCAQLPFIRNATLKDNVLFGRTFDEKCYNSCLDMTALLRDLEVLPAGDATEIGERGINLSGGQKARVSLARAVYGVLLGHRAQHRRTDVLLLDDVLAAVDAHVGRHLFERCLLPLVRDHGVLILWATNALQFTRHCDWVIVLCEGSIVQQGTYESLLSNVRSVNPAVHVRNIFAEMIAAMNSSGAAASVGNLQLQQQQQLLKETSSTASSLLAPAAHANVDSKNESSSDAVGKSTASTSSTPSSLPSTSSTSTGQLVTAERSATGDVSRKVYFTWASAAGGSYVLIMILVFFVAGELLTILSSYWLSLWSEHNSVSTHNSASSGWYFLSIYGVINLFVIFAAFSREYYLRLKGLAAARELFGAVLTHVLYSPMSFFDTTPLGRVTNRLSKDVYTVDEQIPGTIRGYLVTTMRVTITLLYVSSITPLFLVFLLPLGAFYYLAQRFYIKTSRELTRLESSSRSPIYALFSETLDGLVTLRAYKDEEVSVARNCKLVDDNIKGYFYNFSANCWLAVRLEFVGTLIVMGAALFAVIARTSYLSTVAPTDNNGNNGDSRAHLALFAGLAGLSMSLAMSITQSLNWTVRMASDLESQMVAVERLQEYATMNQEAPHYRHSDPTSTRMKSLTNGHAIDLHVSNPMQSSTNHQSNVTWPSVGKISFFNVSLRYRPNLPLVLHNVTFTIPPGHKVGVVGRTGAGKSSLVVALLRLVDPLETGNIYIDDLDIAHLGLHVLRSSIAVIPQDPVLFSGTVRENLDPFHQFTDLELHQSLERCHLRHSHNIQLNENVNRSLSPKMTTSTASVNSHNNHNEEQQKKKKNAAQSLHSLSLEDKVSENGSNFSVGQRQLLCIARALVSRSAVILMDEATAAVDVETDVLIQETIRSECAHATVLTIAHRLNTILDSDKVLVLDNGSVAEYDAPSVLLAKGAQESLFAELVLHWEETEEKE